MKKIAIIAAAMLSASALYAAGINGITAADIKVSNIEVPAAVLPTDVSRKCGHVSGEITKLHLYAQASRSTLFTYAKTEAETREFTAMWTPILEKFGMKVTGTEYKNELFILKYESGDGRVIRMFNAYGMNYDALSSTTIARLQHELLEPLEQAGMTPIASFTIKDGISRPTFNIYYLTNPEENKDHEIQLRQLKNGDDIDFDLLTSSVTLVKKDRSFSMVYIGKLLGFKSKIAADEAGIAAKLADYRKFLIENDKDFIASRTYKLDEPFEAGEHTYNYAVNMYFFQ